MKTVRIEKELDSSDVLGRLWKNRDFELQHLWQRSIFLTAFLSLCLVGYGRLILSVFENHYSPPKMLAVNLAAVGICLVGAIISLLWVAMARGSKAWYEWYEYAIRHYCAEHRFDSTNVLELSRYLSPKCYSFLHGSRIDVLGSDISGEIVSNRGGPYSPSKINILIGHVSTFVFSFLGGAHARITTSLLMFGKKPVELFKNCPYWEWFLVFLFGLISCSVVFLVGSRFARSIQSKSLMCLVEEREMKVELKRSCICCRVCAFRVRWNEKFRQFESAVLKLWTSIKSGVICFCFGQRFVDSSSRRKKGADVQ